MIGDVHGLRTWEQVVKKHSNCKYVFLGDYNDPYAVLIAMRVHLFPYRTQKLSSFTPTILGG